LARKAKHLTTQAKVQHPYEFFHDEIGYNYRCPNINAALFCAQLEVLDQILLDKRNTSDLYRKFIESEYNEIRFFKEDGNRNSNYWLNAILFNSWDEREYFIAKSIERGVMVRPSWKPMNHLPMFQNAWRDELSCTEKVYQTLVNLPSSARV
jgi:dTDP-4-amino-4,6-dideoxygalactose transaminase